MGPSPLVENRYCRGIYMRIQNNIQMLISETVYFNNANAIQFIMSKNKPISSLVLIQGPLAFLWVWRRVNKTKKIESTQIYGFCFSMWRSKCVWTVTAFQHIFGTFLIQCESPPKDVTAQSDEESEREKDRQTTQNIMPLPQEHNVPICLHLRLLPIL